MDIVGTASAGDETRQTACGPDDHVSYGGGRRATGRARIPDNDFRSIGFLPLRCTYYEVPRDRSRRTTRPIRDRTDRRRIRRYDDLRPAKRTVVNHRKCKHPRGAISAMIFHFFVENVPRKFLPGPTPPSDGNLTGSRLGTFRFPDCRRNKRIRYARCVGPRSDHRAPVVGV